MAKEVELNPNEVSIDPAISKGPVDEDLVTELMQSYTVRREANQRHQLNTGTARLKDNGHVVITGRHRLIACQRLNETLGKGEEPFLFHAFVVKDNDLQALESQIVENEKRRKVTIFERGESMQALLDLGRSQDEIAALYGLDKSTVSGTLAANRLPKKLVKMVLNGDMEQDAALLAATIEDKKVQQEIVEHSIASRQFFEDIEERMSKDRAVEKDADDGEEGDEEGDENVPKNKGKSKKSKKSKIKKEDIARAAKQHPQGHSAAKKAASTSGAMSRKQILATFEALRKDKESPLPKSAVAVLSRIEALMDGELSQAALRNNLIKHCVPDAG